MTEIGGSVRPRKKLGSLAWFGIAVAVLVLLPVITFAVNMANDPKNKPLSISDADAVRMCEAKVTSNTKNSGSVTFPGQAQTTKHDKFVDVAGTVASTYGTQDYQCQVIKFDDGTVGAVETTLDRTGRNY